MDGRVLCYAHAIVGGGRDLNVAERCLSLESSFGGDVRKPRLHLRPEPQGHVTRQDIKRHSTLHHSHSHSNAGILKYLVVVTAASALAHAAAYTPQEAVPIRSLASYDYY